MKPDVFKTLPAVLAAVQNPRSARSVLNYMTGTDTSDPAAREGLSTDEVVGEFMEIWFGSGTKLDELAQPFAPVIRELKAGTLIEPEWRTNEGKIAKVLLGDQLARNCFRGTPEAFSYDPLTKGIVEELVSPECIGETLQQPCAILYLLPWALAHQEDLGNLVRAVEVVDLAIAAYPSFNLFKGRNKMAIDQHRAVLKHFGRYPHRNAELGRENTPEEQAWLDDPAGRPGWTPGGKLNFDAKVFDQLES